MFQKLRNGRLTRTPRQLDRISQPIKLTLPQIQLLFVSEELTREHTPIKMLPKLERKASFHRSFPYCAPSALDEV